MCKPQAILVLGSSCLGPNHIPGLGAPARPLPSGHLSLTLSSLLSAPAPKASWSGQTRPYWPWMDPSPLAKTGGQAFLPGAPSKETQEWDKPAPNLEPDRVLFVHLM